MDRYEVAKIVKGVVLDNWYMTVLSKGIVFDKCDKYYPLHDVYEYPNILKLYVKQGVTEYKMLIIEFMEDGKRWERSYFVESLPKVEEDINDSERVHGEDVQ